MKGWVGLVGWPIADGLSTLVVTHQLQVERRTGKVRQSETNLFFAEARAVSSMASAGHMQVCTSLQTDNHASTPALSFLPAGCPSCRPTNSVKALKVIWNYTVKAKKMQLTDDVLRRQYSCRCSVGRRLKDRLGHCHYNTPTGRTHPSPLGTPYTPASAVRSHTSTF